MILTSERLIFRPMELDDAKNVFDYRSDSETNKYQGWIPETIKDVEIFTEKISSQINQPDTWFQFVIIENETEKIVGDLGIHFFDKENKQVEIGCTLDKDYQNKGYATESIERVMDYLFKDLNKHRIIASIDPRHSKSIRLVERLGFRKEAHFVASVFNNGEWLDDLNYALLRKEWEKLVDLK